MVRKFFIALSMVAAIVGITVGALGNAGVSITIARGGGFGDYGGSIAAHLSPGGPNC